MDGLGKVEKMRRALMRSNTRLLLSGVLVFQLLAMALVAFKDETVSVQALVLAAALPLATLMVVNLMGKLWPVDRAILILVLLLVSIGIITLSGIARSEVTPRTQAIYAVAGLVAMFAGAAFVRAVEELEEVGAPCRWLGPLPAGARVAVGAGLVVSRARATGSPSSPTC